MNFSQIYNFLKPLFFKSLQFLKLLTLYILYKIIYKVKRYLFAYVDLEYIIIKIISSKMENMDSLKNGFMYLYHIKFDADIFGGTFSYI